MTFGTRWLAVCGRLLCLQDLSLLLCLSWGGHVTRLGQWDMSGSGMSLAFPLSLGNGRGRAATFCSVAWGRITCLSGPSICISGCLCCSSLQCTLFNAFYRSSLQCILFNAFHYYFTQISAISTQCTDLWSNNCGGIITSSEFYDLPF